MPYTLPHSAVLEIDLSAVIKNYQILSDKLTVGRCSAVVKANAYGLGVEAVAPALAKEGCTDFFVATLEEGIQLRALLPLAEIYIINGFAEPEVSLFSEHRLSPVLNHIDQLWGWADANKQGKGGTSILHLDTGMNRLGLSEDDVQKLADEPELIRTARVQYYMSHLACSDAPKHKLNKQQLTRLKERLLLLPRGPVSFVNSSGIFLGKEYHYDLARPGCALYGINPTPWRKNPMKPVATLTAPILQIRYIEKRESVGYDATYYAKKGDRIATIGIGYADGVFRHLSNKGKVYIAGKPCPIIGRISMDMIMADITKLKPSLLTPTTRAELIGPHFDVDSYATAAGTIGYEAFTRLGRRVRRIYS